MIWRRREGEYFRYGINWQYDRYEYGYWIGLYLCLPYWITPFTAVNDWYGQDTVIASLVKIFRFGFAVSTKTKFHWWIDTSNRMWRKFHD